ncbi:hypothetical protein HK405_015917 [Cladochytrium tenue]|nr:hypothetical protein HK405_015917 [Cladochytrium tenue]
MKVLIVGGGVAGPVLALFLKRDGHDVQLFDRVVPTEIEAAKDTATDVWHPPAVGGGVNLQENVLRVFKRLGLLDEVKAAGIPVSGIDIRRLNGDLIADFGVFNREDYINTNVLRSSLAHIVHAALAKEGVTMQTGKLLVDVRQPEDGSLGVTAIFDDGTSATGDILVGADGVHSAVRRLILPDAKANRSEYIGYIGVSAVSQDYSWTSRALEFLTDNHAGRAAFLMRADADNIQWAIYETKPGVLSFDSWESVSDLAAERAVALDLAKSWSLADWFQGAVAASTRIVRVTFYRMPPLPAWHLHNCVLLGDAAHAMVPWAGQGAAVSIEDAEVLALLLRHVPADHPREAFRHFQQLRKARVEMVSRSSDDLGKSMMANTPFSAAIGHAFLRLFSFISRYTGLNLNSTEITNYDAHDATMVYLKSQGLV